MHWRHGQRGNFRRSCVQETAFPRNISTRRSSSSAAAGRPDAVTPRKAKAAPAIRRGERILVIGHGNEGSSIIAPHAGARWFNVREHDPSCAPPARRKVATHPSPAPTGQPSHVRIDRSARPPSGVTQLMFWAGSLISQVLQWTQFCALITKARIGLLSPRRHRPPHTPPPGSRAAPAHQLISAGSARSGCWNPSAYRWQGCIFLVIRVGEEDRGETMSKVRTPSGLG